ncbi:MAG: glucan biosynthesis protein G [Rhodobacteraceae bacterium]|nr:glucan biosynthesis protein G [Paracoccaceae bacterium]
MMLSRRALLALLAASGLAGRLHAAQRAAPAGAGTPFSRAWLEAEARRLAARPHEPVPEVPEGWRALTYDQYRAIWFNPERGLWTGGPEPFKVDFFHPGLYFPRPVVISVVEGGIARPVPFDIDLFDRTDQFPDLPVDATMGYSGLRLRAELETPGIFTEFMVFQGASYFRAIGTGQTYGLSARGLALDTGEPQGEEFPAFTRFWLERPAPEDRTIRLHALLDGPSVTGAYSFLVAPGPVTEVAVEATVFPRRELSHVGLAPLTSMFLFDETNRARFDDFRSAVHDSEGLMIWNGAGELLWRPLANPRELQVSSFVDAGPRGFGLMQRARGVEDYGDLEAHYHERPSLWIVPGEDWGEGAVTLVEIPADKEIYDNIVAYWRPAKPLAPGQGHAFSYTMRWGEEPPRPRDVARVLKTRIGKGYDKSRPYTVVAIDFEAHPGLDAAGEGVGLRVLADRGTVSGAILQQNPGTGGWRLAFKFDPGEATAAELRAEVLKDGAPLTEVWLYRWTA